MKAYRVIYSVIVVITFVAIYGNAVEMSKAERKALKEEARKMFYHGYHAYMDNAYPADELMPLSCKGRLKGITPSRGDMDDALGNYSLTLVDSMDMLALMGDFGEFSRAVKLVADNIDFDQDVVVSVFETNIRVLGGLLSAHVFASKFNKEIEVLKWYNDELLRKAEDLGRRLLPAFNSTTGIPHGRINLKHGLNGLKDQQETCTACAGTMILEMAALSRLSGDSEFEKRSQKAMDELWNIRHRTSDLMGTIINIETGEWVRKDSGVGAGIDSYYEYCLKAYILLGDEKYLARFNRYYNAVMKYISRGPLLLDVHMHRPHLQSRNFMDALLAFWPGLQVLLGDIRPAVATHEMLYQVMQKYTFIPEAFSADMQVIWGQHPLRPEFLESTYFLHRATNDDHYLFVGKAALKSLQKYARVSCGYAAVNDVRTRKHEDRMDSFVLAETFKYLYLMFSENKDLPMAIDNYVMTTEAHFLPLALGNVGRNESITLKVINEETEHKYTKACPTNVHFVAADVRRPMQNMFGGLIRPLPSLEPLTDPQQIEALEEMGITVISMSDGRVQLLYSTTSAKTQKDAADGLQFMKDMSQRIEMENIVNPLGVKVNDLIIPGGPGRFGKNVENNDRYINQLVYTNPADACKPLINKAEAFGKFGVAVRGECTFAQKARNMKDAGMQLAIITDNVPGTSHETSPLFAMSGDGINDIDMPAVFLFHEDAELMLEAYQADSKQVIYIGELESMKREYEQGCPNGVCDGPFPNKVTNSDNDLRKFANLKEVLHHLAAEFELSMHSDEFELREKTQPLSNLEKYVEATEKRSKIVPDDYRDALSVSSERKYYTNEHFKKVMEERKNDHRERDTYTMVMSKPRHLGKEITETQILPSDSLEEQYKKVSDNI